MITYEDPQAAKAAIEWFNGVCGQRFSWWYLFTLLTSSLPSLILICSHSLPQLPTLLFCLLTFFLLCLPSLPPSLPLFPSPPSFTPFLFLSLPSLPHSRLLQTRNSLVPRSTWSLPHTLSQPRALGGEVDLGGEVEEVEGEGEGEEEGEEEEEGGEVSPAFRWEMVTGPVLIQS